ncbi:hypothetical protein HGRIS_012875 [Hohenbuehelia grisea]|uniref:Transmembrane protein n=1 Tax=Hohenbuehelia grisea TaxID=104357 RepID=A0ABR3ITT0_9AGAR
MYAERSFRRCAFTGCYPHAARTMQQGLLLFWAVLYNVCFVDAQATNAVCAASFGWASNSLNQSPCLVAAYLQSACIPNFSVPALPSGNHYFGPPPGGVNECSCSSVVYSLISACGACQNRTWADWGTWRTNCGAEVTNVGRFPRDIPGGTAVPGWAFMNISTTNNTFFPAVAQALVGTPEATGSAKPTAAPSPENTTPQTTLSTLPSISAAPSRSGATSTSHSNAGAIAGGIVGGLAVIAIIAILAWWIITRRKTRIRSADFTMARPAPFPDSPSETPMKEAYVSNPPGIPVIHVSSPEPLTSSDSLNYTSSTPAPSTIYTTHEGQKYPTGHEPTHRGYSGAPEIC